MIRVGTRGTIVDVDGNRGAQEFSGARAKVLERRYFPDGLVVEMLDDGPLWRRGQRGEIALRYFVPDARGSGKPTKRTHSRMVTSKSSEALTERDYREAAKFEMSRFGLTLPEATKLVKDRRYPGILKTIEDWRARHGWPAASSAITRGYVFDLLGLQRGRR